jgi:hypothetical protein
MEGGKAEILPVGAILAGLLPTGTARSSLACLPRAVLSSHPIGENDRTPPDRLLCPSLLTETAVLTILCTQESLRLGFIKLSTVLEENLFGELGIFNEVARDNIIWRGGWNA